MNINHRKITTYMAGLISFFLLLSLIFPQGSWSEETNKTHLVKSTFHARLAVEQAWETYHHAALGGTLSSPVSQTELEMNLHKSRALLASAYEAEDRGDIKMAHKLIKQIMQITDKVIVESQEPKK